MQIGGIGVILGVKSGFNAKLTQILISLNMQKKVYKYENRLSVSYPADVCRRIFFYSTVLGLNMQDIQRTAVSEWLERQDEKRLDRASRFESIDKD